MISNRRRFAALLLLVLVLGSGLRWSQLDKKSLWSDELFTLSMAGHHPLVPTDGMRWFERKQVTAINDADSFLTAKAAEQSPPLNDLLEMATVHWLGMTELAARLPAAVASCALLLWFAWFAWRHPEQLVRRTLAWATLLLALHPSLQLYAQDGRAYSVGVSLIGMGGLLWMLRWRHGPDQWRPPGWGEIALLTLACYTHYNAAVMVAILLAPDAWAATRRSDRRAWWRLLTLAAAFSVWLGLNAHAIVFTAQGGVAWHNLSTGERLVGTALDWYSALNGYLLIVVLAVGIGQATSLRLAAGDARKSWYEHAYVSLAAMTVVYLLVAAWVVSRAGMGHPRFYIFATPLVVVAMAMVLAEVPTGWRTGFMLAVVVAVTWPAMREARHMPKEDFRAIASDAVKWIDAETPILFPNAANRNTYRIYLERFWKRDPRPQMVDVNAVSDAAAVCARIVTARKVAVQAHDSGKSVIDAVYAQCGANWPNRQRRQFHIAYSEQWEKNE